VYFNWAGYSDCVDVNVVSGTTPVAHRYGVKPASTTSPVAVKLDHCQWSSLTDMQTSPRILNKNTLSVDACIADCAAQGTGCIGVQVVRASNPSGTLATGVNYPNHPMVWNDTAWKLSFSSAPWDVSPYDAGYFDPCMSWVANNRNQWGCKSVSAGAAKIRPASTDHICFGVLPHRNQDLQVSEDYFFVKDAADPAWYSTCFLMTSSNTFLNIPPVANSYKPPSWAVAQKCMNCTFWASLSKVKYNSVPDWSKAFANQCINCSFVSDSAPVAMALASDYDEGMTANGSPVFTPTIDPTVGPSSDEAANAPPADPDTDNSPPDDSQVNGLSSRSGLSKTAIIAIAAAAGGAVLLLVVVALALRYRAAQAAAAAIKRMSTAGQEMTSNPVTTTASSSNFTAC